MAVKSLLLADVFVPDFGVSPDVGGEEADAFVRIKIDDNYAEGAEPVDAALESARFADDDAREAELADQATAIPAGSKGGDHGEFAVAALAASVAEGVGFAVERRVAVLHAAIVAGTDEVSLFVENRGADGDAAFGEAFAGFGDGHGEHRSRIKGMRHGRDYKACSSEG